MPRSRKLDSEKLPPLGRPDCELAGLVWSAAFPKGAKLSRDQLEELGEKLSLHVIDYANEVDMVAGVGDKKAMDNIYNIERLSKELNRLIGQEDNQEDNQEGDQEGDQEANLEKQEEILKILSIYYPYIHDLSLSLRELAKAASKVYADVKRKSKMKSPKGNSPLDRFIMGLADCYEKYSGETAGGGVNAGEVTSPFIRFVRQAAQLSEEFARPHRVPVPAGPTIRAALAKRKQPGMVKHVIDLLK